MTDWDHNSVREVHWVSGAALLIRRDVLDSIGLLDERFFMYCEDMDLCRRARHAGWQVLYYPEAEIVHSIGGSSSKACTRMVVEFHKSMYRFYCKYNNTVFGRILAFTVGLGLVARLFLVFASAKLARTRSRPNADPAARHSRQQAAEGDGGH
jgi:hypothetical protein